MAKETKCDNCGTDINTADVFEEAIHAQVHMGYFMKMNYFCAPDTKTADELIDDMKEFYRENQDTTHKEVRLDG